MSNLKVATFLYTSNYFICRYCWNNNNRTHIAERESFEARIFMENGEYTGHCVFKNLVNVLPNETQIAGDLQDICCVRCNQILGSKFIQLPPLLADRKGSFYRLNMDTVCYWDGHSSLQAEEGLPAMLAEAGQHEADPLQDPGHEAQVQAAANPVNQVENGMDAAGAWYYG